MDLIEVPLDFGGKGSMCVGVISIDVIFARIIGLVSVNGLKSFQARQGDTIDEAY